MPVLHVVTDDDILAAPDFLTRAAGIIAALGPRGAFHIRGHRTSAKILYDIATALAPLASLAGVTLIINDRVDIALAVHAGGVQIGPRSFRTEQIRHIAPNMRIGVSVHSVAAASVAAASRASGADWLIAGHIFDTPSHAGEPSRGLAFLEQICRVSSVPVIAIGGIEPRHVRPVREAGAHGVAVIRGIWDAPEGAVQHYLGEFDR